MNKQKYIVFILAIIISALIEILICNFPFWKTLITQEPIEVTNYNKIDNLITINDINTRLNNIYIDYNNKITSKITYYLSYSSEESSETFYINQKSILPGKKHYINFDTHSACKSLELAYLTLSDVEINQIFLNYPIFNFSLLRMFILFTVSIFFLKIKILNILKIEYNYNNKDQHIYFLLNLILLCILIFFYTFIQLDYNTIFIHKNNITKEDSILMQTEAIINNQIELLEKPSQELITMENPYDPYARKTLQTDFLYDVAYYNGNYYNYFGIAPVITSILPFRIITGYYIHTYIFNFIYMFIAVISLYYLYRNLIKEFIKKVSLVHFYLGFYTILLGSNFFTLLRGEKYDIVVSSGIMFILLSMNLTFSIYKNTKWRKIKLILLGITIGLIVLSKPNFIVYYPIILLLLLFNMKNLNNNKEKIIDIIFILIPLGLLAIFQMYLNYIRFDNIFEFGAKYQLTGFNMNYCMSITFGKIYTGLLEYFFKLPVIQPLNFPFIFINTNISSFSINEICYENRLIGLAGIPIMYAWLLKNNIKKENKNLDTFLNTCFIIVIISIILNTCFGGICETYSIDFKLIFAICSILILLKLNEKENALSNKILLILTITTIILMIPINLTTEKNFLLDTMSDLTLYLKNVFEFWN